MVDVKSNLVTAFEKYKSIIFSIDVDLNFWTSFITNYISNYQQREDINNEMYISGFAVYDWNVSNGTGYLKMNPLTRLFYKSELDQHRADFFTWIRNLAVLKSYNALEMFLIQAIWVNYFPKEKNPTISKKAADNIQIKIREELISKSLSTDSKNNRHLVEFLKSKESEYHTFLSTALNIDITTTWADFFEMFSILRNIIAHQGTIVLNDTHNEIKSKAKDIFQRHFDVVKDAFKESHLKPKETNFSDFISSVNVFTLNTVKIMSREPDFSFLSMY